MIGTPTANIESDKLENVFCKVIEIKARGREQLFIESCKICKGRYILLIKPQEVISVKNQRKLVEELKKNEASFMYLNVVSNFVVSSSDEFRIMKNNEEIKSFISFTNP